MRTLLIAASLLALLNCRGDQTVANYGGSDTKWQLISIDGKPFTARATLQFGEAGAISGEAPCNTYFATQTAPYPWFSIENVGSTRRACPELDQEVAYFAALTEMTLSEVAGKTLILSNDAGRELLYNAAR